jgi:hypothetical protein
MAELTDPSADEWTAGLPELELKPGRWLQLGDHDYGHMLLWDADADEVMLYSPDDGEPHRLQRTIEDFFARLFRPSAKASNEANQLWREALAEADKLAS